MSATHEVLNQVPPLVNRDVSVFPALLEGLHREGSGWAEQKVLDLGLLAGSEAVRTWSVKAEEHAPVLRTHDRYGIRIDEVEYGQSYHELMLLAFAAGLGEPRRRRSAPARTSRGRRR